MDAKILRRVELPDGQGAVTLYDWMAIDVRDGRNLIRTDEAGTEMWRATPVSGPEDCFTSLSWSGVALTAHTWSCYCVAVDLRDGSVTVLEFTK